jgi:hypothetical protein
VTEVRHRQKNDKRQEILMRLTDLKRPRFYLPATIVLLLGIVSAVVFHPDFQRKMLLDHLGPLVDSLDIGYIHLTPWSLQLKNVSVGYRGGHFSIGDGTLRYCLSSLLLLNLNIKTLALKDISIDLEKFVPPKTAEKPARRPFPGVLASLQHGLSYTLQEVNINAAVHLSGQRLLTATISGGGIQPKARGLLKLALGFSTGNRDEQIAVEGRLALDQLTRGRFNAIETVLAMQATLATLPETERVNLKLGITPAAAGQQATRPPATAPKGPHYTPEALRLAMRLDDAQGNNRSELDLEGTYDGNTGGIDGRYQFTANERLVQPYLKRAVIPPSGEVLTGEFSFNSASLTGDMTVTSDLAMKDIRELHPREGLPEGLNLRNSFRVSLRPGGRLRVETLDTTIYDDANHERLASKLPGALHIPLDNPAAFLHQENTLLDFTLPGLPLAWLNAFLPDHEVTGGILKAAFEVTTDTSGAIHLKPVRPLEVTGLTVREQDSALVEGLNLSVLPGASYHGDALSISLRRLAVDAGNGTLATADLSASIPLSGATGADITAQAEAELDLHRLLDALAIEPPGRTNLPRHLRLAYQVALRQQPGLMTVKKLDASLSLENKARLLQLHLMQPFIMETAHAGRRFGNTAGELATLTISDIDLDWFSAFVPDTTLKGQISRTDLTLTAEAQGVATLSADKALAIRHLTVAGPQRRLLDDLGVRLRPTVRLAPTGTRIAYQDLDVTSRRTRLVSGSGHVHFPAAPDQPLAADGHLEVNLQALSRQPVIARALQAAIDAPLRLEADYRLAQGDGAIDIDRLSANLFYSNPDPRLSLRADSKLRVRTRLGGRQSELGRATGRVTLALAKLTPEPFSSILKARGLAFTEANGEAVLVSDGRSLTVDTVNPLVVTGISVRSANGEVLSPFTVKVNSKATLRGNTLQAKLEELSVAFARNRSAHALDAHAELTLKDEGGSVSIDTLKAELSASLPPLLDQPAILPGHTLTAGTLTARVNKDASGRFAAITRIGDLTAREALALQTLTLDVEGHLSPDGGFNLTAPLREQGKSGNSDIQMKAAYAPSGGSNKPVDIDIDSSVFYLNDIVDTLRVIAGKQRAAPARQKRQAAATQEPQVPELRPDARPFWDTTNFYNARVNFRLDRLFYTDYLEFRDIKGQAALLPDKLEVGDFAAHFHDSPITLDARLTFSPGDTPYDLKLRAGVKQFDLAKFFRALVPGSTPRAEGLFDVDLSAFGTAPNLPQYRNDLYFDMRLLSRDGVFRPFRPDNSLVAGSSDVAGALGLVASNVPTGLFGLGAVSRLVNYIKEIKYNKMKIHLVRDESRNVKIKEYVVQSPDILVTATGGITYQEGLDIVDSPLSMKARIDMRERGAAILYSLGLLQKAQDNYGYWKGPVFKVWGRIARTESNLDDIIREAGRGAVLGGITRPVAGLWGNLKYWWFGGGKTPEEYKGQ